MMTGKTARGPWQRRLYKIAFWLSIPCLLVILSSLMVGHWYTLPKPQRDSQQLVSSLATLRKADESRSWMAVHVLYSGCGCSKRVLEHLLGSERTKLYAEKLLLVGPDPRLEARAKQAGLDVTVLTPTELKERFGLETAPLFLGTDRAHAIRYVGGYTERKRGPAIADRSIMAQLLRDGDAAERPLFGCAVSRSLQQVLDPLRLKYRNL